MRKLLSLTPLLVALLTLSTSAAAAVTPAPNWSLEDLQHNIHHMTDWRGKWVLIKLGRTDCPECTIELGQFEKAADTFKKLGVHLIDIYVKQDRYDVKKYVSERKELPNSQVLYDWEGKLVRTYGLTFIPVLILVNPEGNIVWRGGFTYAADLTKILTSHIDVAKQ